MARSSSRGLGALFLRIALTAYFIITGLCMLGVGGSVKASEAGAAVQELFSGDVAKIVGILLAVFLIIGGLCIAVSIFRDLGRLGYTVMLVLSALWIVIAVIADGFTRSFGVSNLDGNVMFWILNVAKDLLIIGGLLSIR